MSEQNDEQSGPQSSPVEAPTETPEKQPETKKRAEKPTKAEAKIQEIVEAAASPGATVAGLSRTFKISRETVRKILDSHGVTLESQEEVALRVKESDAKIVEAENAMLVSAQTRQWSQELVKRNIESARLVGMAVTDRLAPLAHATGRTVDQLLDDMEDAWRLQNRLWRDFGALAQSYGSFTFEQFVTSCVTWWHLHRGDPQRIEELTENLRKLTLIAERMDKQLSGFEMAKEVWMLTR